MTELNLEPNATPSSLNKDRLQYLWGEALFNLYQENVVKKKTEKQNELALSLNNNLNSDEQVTADILRKDLINLVREKTFLSPSRSLKQNPYEASMTTSLQNIETSSDLNADTNVAKEQFVVSPNQKEEDVLGMCDVETNQKQNEACLETPANNFSEKQLINQSQAYSSPATLLNLSNNHWSKSNMESQKKISHDYNNKQFNKVTANEEDPYIDQATAAAINLQRGEEELLCVGDLSPDDEELLKVNFTDRGKEEKNFFVESKTKIHNYIHYASDVEEEEKEKIEANDDDEISKMTARNLKSSASQKLHRSSTAWKLFFSKIQRLQQVEHSASSYLENIPKVSELKRNIFFDQLLTRQSDQYGQYIHLQQNKDFALISAANREIVNATKMISQLIALRSEFQLETSETLSPCVFPPSMNNSLGHGSTEPLFKPLKVSIPKACLAECIMEEGVYTVYWSNPEKTVLVNEQLNSTAITKTFKGQTLINSTKHGLPSVSRFLEALKQIMKAVQHPACKAFSYQRLLYLKNRFQMHLMFNTAAELDETKKNKHRDFYNVRKVDTHVHHSACMHQKHLLRFIRRKYLEEPNQIVAKTRDGRPVTLHEIFHQEVGVSAWDASVDLLNVHALGSCFHRFDIFNLKYNPFGQPLLREVFLKTNNMIEGRYLAEITQEVLVSLEEQKYQMMEWRVSIHGKRYDEWSKVAKWVYANRLTSQRIRWMVQVPRLYHVHRKLYLVSNFAELLRNIFEPVFRAVIDPESNKEIYYFLLQMSGWDSVDDESIVSKYTSEGGELPIPEDWKEPTNPPYSYWAYYMYANIRNLNILMASRGMRTLPFRPHCGEAGSISHLASMYLLANNINHGIVLRKSPVLQYLYYLQQIGLAISPLSNNALFHDISKNPFYNFFCTGLNVSLSTDDPLMFHFTDEPLLEEYSCCAHVWKLSPVDLCEIARNSVLQSHFEPQFKKHWLGENYTLPGKRGNDMQKSNVSNIRLQYREDTLIAELAFISDVLKIQKLATEFIQ